MTEEELYALEEEVLAYKVTFPTGEIIALSQVQVAMADTRHYLDLTNTHISRVRRSLRPLSARLVELENALKRKAAIYLSTDETIRKENSVTDRNAQINYRESELVEQIDKKKAQIVIYNDVIAEMALVQNSFKSLVRELAELKDTVISQMKTSFVNMRDGSTTTELENKFLRGKDEGEDLDDVFGSGTVEEGTSEDTEESEEDDDLSFVGTDLFVIDETDMSEADREALASLSSPQSSIEVDELDSLFN